MEEFKRFPAHEVLVKDIDPSKHRRARILGTVISVGQGDITIDDGTGSATIITTPEMDGKTEVKKLVRVIGRVMPNGDGYDVQAEVLQDMTGLDVDKYRKAQELFNA